LHYTPGYQRARGLKGAPEVIGRKNFIELCEVVTKEDEAAFRHLWTRLGLSYDWEQEYATIDAHCRRTSQASFLDLLRKNEAYQDNRPVMWDIDFQTAIAQAEVVDKEVPSAYHHLRFGIEGSGACLVIATTRPELLAACVAVVVHPEDARYTQYVGKNAVTPLFKAPVPILADEKADPEKGTGVVMVCTFGDQTDVEWWRDFKLPMRQILGGDGRLRPVTFGPKGGATGFDSLDPDAANAVYAQLQGLNTKKAQAAIVEIAETSEGVIDSPKKEIVHAVKYFEKGDRPLELIPARQWYVKIIDKKEALLRQGRKIQWYPEFMHKRYEHWVEGLNSDWCLSRQRFFGVPIPVWYKVDAQGLTRYDQIIVPSADTLPIDPLDDVPPGYSEEQRNQPGGFTGDPDVLDTWATSSLTPQIASRWIEDPERHKKLFPMDMRPQSHEIIRTWAFYTIVKAYLHEDEIPWRNVVISGWILDPDRKKMAKSVGNVITPEPLIDQYGTDSVRYWAARARLGVDTAYDEQVFKVGRKLCTKLFNASKFAIGRFADVDAAELGPEKITAEVDRAAVAELRPLLERATSAFDEFDYAQALGTIEDFFWRVFCDNYLEIAKPRTYEDALTPERLSACATLRLLHRCIVRLLAPFVPYIAEEVWQWAYAGDADMKRSVHVSPWPSVAELAGIPAPGADGLWNTTVEVVDLLRKAKADANKSLAAPLQHATIMVKAGAVPALETALDDIKKMLRVENAVICPAQDESVASSVQVVFEEVINQG